MVTISKIHLAFWNHEYISVQSTLACQPNGVWGHIPQENFKIKLSKMVFSATFQRNKKFNNKDITLRPTYKGTTYKKSTHNVYIYEWYNNAFYRQ